MTLIALLIALLTGSPAMDTAGGGVATSVAQPADTAGGGVAAPADTAGGGVAAPMDTAGGGVAK